jgi:hypothetical protein
MIEKQPGEIDLGSDDGAALGSDNKPDSPIPQNSQSLGDKGSGSEATMEDTAEQSFRRRGATGPRTEQGKQKSSRNATKHGMLSKVIILEGEPSDEYEELLTGMQESLQPEGTLEELLVEKLATLVWRQRRLLMAEGETITRS